MINYLLGLDITCGGINLYESVLFFIVSFVVLGYFNSISKKLDRIRYVLERKEEYN